MYGGSGTQPKASKTCCAVRPGTLGERRTAASTPSSSPSSRQGEYTRSTCSLISTELLDSGGACAVKTAPGAMSALRIMHRQTWPTQGLLRAATGSSRGRSGAKHITSMPSLQLAVGEDEDEVQNRRAARTRDALATRCEDGGRRRGMSEKLRSSRGPAPPAAEHTSVGKPSRHSGTATKSRDVWRGTAGYKAIKSSGKS
mmetsp:Transcript_109895/g.267183  ORF Transcript_109895/g.267183 Transcript_109895/m.267183 type:complete len:200 (-) Transcript_109895:411-1010(-)